MQLPNDEVERRAVAPTQNKADLFQSSTPSLGSPKTLPSDRSNRLLCAGTLCTCGDFIDHCHCFLETSAGLFSICLYGLDAFSRICREAHYMIRWSDLRSRINA